MQDVAIKSIHKALAAQLASHKIDDAIVSKVAGQVVQDGMKVGRLDLFPYGILIDYFADRRISIDKLLENKRFRTIKVFPYGVVATDLFHVRVELEVPELAGQIGR